MSNRKVIREYNQTAMTRPSDYYSLFKTMSCGVIFWDAKGNFVEAKPAAVNILVQHSPSYEKNVSEMSQQS